MSPSLRWQSFAEILSFRCSLASKRRASYLSLDATGSARRGHFTKTSSPCRLSCSAQSEQTRNIVQGIAMSSSISMVLQAYTPPQWANRLNWKPKYKVQLAIPNTPIHPWQLSGVPEGFSLHIKRDDLTGSTLSGNKVRKLEFLVADALQQGCQHLLTAGGVQSNHCRAVAVAAAQLGLTSHLFLRCDAEDVDSVECTGNVLLDRLCGAHLYCVPRPAPYETELRPRMEQLARHIESNTGEKAYLIPVGGSNSVGLYGYLSVFEELRQQGALEQFDDLVFTLGSGGTAAGLSIGNFLTGSKLRCHGIPVCDNATYFHGHVNEQLLKVGLNDVKSEDILDIIDGYKGRGYSLSTEQELDFITRVSRETGVMLDPTYTGKAAFGLLQELSKNPGRFQGSRILFLHTGGIYGLFDGRLDGVLKRPSSETNRVTLWKDKTGVPQTLKL